MSVIIIGGMIGLGKTSVAEVLSEALGSQVFYESVEDNPVLPLFYSSTQEEIEKNRYPFLLQLFFLDKRFKAIKEALVNQNNILDRGIYEDLYFCKMNMEYGKMKGENRITEMEWQIYQGLFENMMEEIEGMPKKAPDLMVYLKGDFEKTVLPRIQQRGREYELDAELVEYYKFLWSQYDEWVFTQYNASPIVVIDMDNIDVVNNPEDREDVINLVLDKLEYINSVVNGGCK